LSSGFANLAKKMFVRRRAQMGVLHRDPASMMFYGNKHTAVGVASAKQARLVEA
jgi:hypothetical protein